MGNPDDKEEVKVEAEVKTEVQAEVKTEVQAEVKTEVKADDAKEEAPALKTDAVE